MACFDLLGLSAKVVKIDFIIENQTYKTLRHRT